MRYGSDSAGNLFTVTALSNSDSGSHPVTTYGSYDGIGRPQAITDPNGNVTSYEYDAFGRETGVAGMHFYRSRFLQAGVGRFGSEDPLMIVPGSSKYSYALNDAVLHTDPTGAIPPVVAAILVNAGIGFVTDVAVQLVFNDFRIECVDWAQAGVSAGISGALGGALGARSLVRRAGTEWSHWVPKRYSNPSSKFYKGIPGWVTSRRSLVGKLNGNFTTPLRHYRHDPFRYLNSSITEDIAKYPTWLQQVDRVPN